MSYPNKIIQRFRFYEPDSEISIHESSGHSHTLSSEEIGILLNELEDEEYDDTDLDEWCD